MTSPAGAPGPEVRKRGSRFWASIDERLGLDAFRYKVPGYGNTLPYTLGGITFFGFIVLVLTGVYLGQFYHPHPTIANDSVRAIILEVPLGAFVRSVHFWTAQAVLVSVALHVTRVFMTAAYKKPREFNWYIGIALLATAIGLFFTGTVLKWDQEAFEALEHNVEIGALLGALGSFFSPTFAAQVPLLTRLYSVHVSLLPLIFGALLVAHVFYVRHFGIAPRAVPEKDTKEETYEPFTGHMKKIVVYGVVLLGIVGVLALAFPAPLGPQPIEGIEVTKPPWPFLWLFPFENLWGVQAILPISILPFLLLLAVPIVDRTPGRDPQKRKTMMIGFLLGLALFVALTIAGALIPMAQHVGG